MDLIMNDEFGDMDSADSLDTSDSEVSTNSEIESDPEVDFSGHKVFVDIPKRSRGRTSKRARVRGGLRMRGSRGQVNVRCRCWPRLRGARYIIAPNIEVTNEYLEEDNLPFDVSRPDVSSPFVTDNDTSNDENPIPPGSASDNDMINDNWKNHCPKLNDFTFTEIEGMNIDIPDNADPMFFFKLLLSDQFIEAIVKTTNDYAHTVVNSTQPLRRRSVTNEWRDVTVDDMNKFLGMVLHMGLVLMPSYRCYWSKSRLYKNDIFNCYEPRTFPINHVFFSFQ